MCQVINKYTQLNLFTTKQCTHCRRYPGPGKNPRLWDGFLDKDTGQLVCWRCHTRHYKHKKPLTYSEVPVPL